MTMFQHLKKKIETLEELFRTKATAQSVQQQLLIPLMSVLVLLVGGFGIVFYKTQQANINRTSQLILKGAEDELSRSLAEQADMLSALQDVFLFDMMLPYMLKTHDRQVLLAVYEPVFTHLRKEYGITQFRIHLPNRVNLLCLNSPEMTGDHINTFVIRKAERTKKRAWGIELCPKKFVFSLWVVKPVFIGNKLIGYLELGKEIEDILAGIHDEHEIELAVAIHKNALEWEKWEAGMKMLGRKSNWDRFSDSVLIYSSLPRFPSEWDSFVCEEGHSHHTLIAKTKWGGKSWHMMASPLKDVSGTEVGDLLVFYDVTKTVTQFNRLFAAVSVSALVLLTVLFGFLYIALRRVDRVGKSSAADAALYRTKDEA